MAILLADGIGPEGLLLLGGAYFLIPAAAVVLLEAFVLRWVLPLTFRRAFKWSFWANALSGVAGIPFLWFFSAKFDSFVPSDLHLYFAAYVRFAVIRYIIYFVMSVVVEFGAGVWMNARLPAPIDRRRLFLAFFLSNAASYGGLCAPYYFMTRPTHTFARITGDTAWSSDTTSAIFFIDPATNYLCRTDPTGMKPQTVVPFPMSEYQLSPDLRTCVYERNGGVYYYRHGLQPTEVTQVSEQETRWHLMMYIALSPSGEKVAYTKPVSKTNEGGYQYTGSFSLCIFDATTGKTIQHKELFPGGEQPMLAWTKDESALLCGGPFSKSGFRCTLTGLSATLGDDDYSKLDLCPNHGTFRPEGLQYDFQVRASDRCTSADLYATVYSVLAPQTVIVSRKHWGPFSKGDVILRLDDNPGIPILSSRRQYSDIAFLPNSSLVVLADETFSTLYLIDPSTRTIGKIIPGRAPVLLTSKYEMKTYFGWSRARLAA